MTLPAFTKLSAAVYIDGVNVEMDDTRRWGLEVETALSTLDEVATSGVLGVADLTALKAVDTAQTVIAYLRPAGREGLFEFKAGNYSSQITADTAEGIYIKADAVASSSGAWVRSFSGPWDICWFGAKFDGATDDVAAFAGVMSLAPSDESTVCSMPAGITRWASTLHHSKPVRFVGQGRGETSTNTNGTGTPGTTIQWSGADAAVMCFMCVQTMANVIAGTTTGDVLFWAGYEDCSVNGDAGGGNYANTFCWHASTQEHVFRLSMRAFRDHGLIGDGGNAALSLRGKYDFRIIYGVAAANNSMGGLLLRAYNGQPSTQNEISRCWGLVHSGNGLTLEETDNNHVGVCHIFNAGSGKAILFKNGPSSAHSRYNRVDYVSGDVHAESGTRGNVIHLANSEGQTITAASGAQLHYVAVDYVTAELYETFHYVMSDFLDVSASLVNSSTGVAAALDTFWRGVAMGDAGTTSALFNAHPSHWDDGNIVGVTLLFTMAGANTTKNARMQVRMSAKSSTDAAMATAQKSEAFTVAVPAAALTLQKTTLTFGTPLSITKGEFVGGLIDRLGADGADDAAGNLNLIGLVLNYVSSGPNSGGSGPYAVTPPFV